MSRYPYLQKIISEAPEYVSFRDSPDVEANCWSYFEDGQIKFDCDESSINLLLPVITREEYGVLPKKFKIKVPHYFQEESGAGTWINFYFSVFVEGADFFNTGEVQLKYSFNLDNFEYDSV